MVGEFKCVPPPPQAKSLNLLSDTSGGQNKQIGSPWSSSSPPTAKRTHRNTHIDPDHQDCAPLSPVTKHDITGGKGDVNPLKVNEARVQSQSCWFRSRQVSVLEEYEQAVQKKIVSVFFLVFSVFSVSARALRDKLCFKLKRYSFDYFRLTAKYAAHLRSSMLFVDFFFSVKIHSERKMSLNVLPPLQKIKFITFLFCHNDFYSICNWQTFDVDF